MKKQTKDTAEVPEKVHVCRARREGDEMVCHFCAVRWATDEEKPTSTKCS